ncbi:MAG: arylsulfatase [Kiritimatiellaeota bacterium]|nr:arylsulfatase [Kiritimatiellota bacterium]
MIRTLAGALPTLFLSCILTAPAASGDYFAKNNAPRPNILLIMSDDMGISDIGCYGGEIKTPALDRLARGGVRFKQFYNTGRCCPTRASLLTGLYPHQAGIGHMLSDRGYDGYRGELAPNSVTIAEVLRPAGYRTYMIGKWHVTTNIRDTGDQRNWPMQRGFDKFYGIVIGAASFYDPASLTRGNKNITPENDTLYQPKTYYFTDAITDNTVTYLREHQEDEKISGQAKPFFAYVAYTAAHWPMHALPEDMAKYKGAYAQGWDALRAARREKMIKLGLLDEQWGITPRDAQEPAWDTVPAEQKNVLAARMEVYAAMVDRMDQGIGKIVDELKKQGKFDNTLVLFLQDNGGCAEPFGLCEKTTPPLDTTERVPAVGRDDLQFNLAPLWTRDGRPIHRGANVMPGPETTYVAYGRPWANASNAPFRLYKHWQHEGGIASPLIVAWHAFFKSRAAQVSGWVQGPGHLIDLMATCADVAGATYPQKRQDVRVIPCEGESLVNMFLGNKLQRDTLYWEHEGNRAVLQGDWKLVANGAVQGPWELYDMRADRCEMNDLAGKMPEKVAELDKLWQAWAERAQVLPLNPPGKAGSNELKAEYLEGHVFPMDPRPGVKDLQEKRREDK